MMTPLLSVENSATGFCTCCDRTTDADEQPDEVHV
jgi:hypothetical protein